jgi:surface protein
MSRVFEESQFNGDISKWDMSKVTDMKEMFWSSKFNGDISKWDVSKVTDMKEMFYNSKFNGDISKWDVSRVIDNDAVKEKVKNQLLGLLDTCTGVYGLIAVNFKDELKNDQAPDPQELTELFELSEYTLGQFIACGVPTKEKGKVIDIQLKNGDFDHLLLKNLNNKKSVKKVINLSIKQCIDQEMDVANKTLAKYGSNPTAEQMLDVSIENGISLSETMHCKRLSEEKPWEYAQEAARRF